MRKFMQCEGMELSNLWPHVDEFVGEERQAGHFYTLEIFIGCSTILSFVVIVLCSCLFLPYFLSKCFYNSEP